MNTRIFSIVVCALVVCIPGYMYAHDDGKSYEKQVGIYLLDVGYNPDPVIEGESVYFDFRLYQKEPIPGAAPYSDVWVRIAQGSTTIFASGIAPTTGQAGMVYTFGTPGTYTVSTRFERGTEILGETSFEVEVQKAGETKSSRLLLHLGSALLGALLPIGVIVVVRLRAKRRK